MPNQWTRENIAWLSGLFEGEGSVSVRKQDGKNHRVSVAIGMTDEDVIRKAAKIAKAGSVTGPYGPYRPNEKPIWRWQVARYEDCQAILVAMYSFLCSRRQNKIIEVLKIVQQSELPPRQYAAKEFCGRKHSRAKEAYQNDKGHWICRACRRLTQNKRKVAMSNG